MCNCHSYNGDSGAVPEVILPAPPWLDVSDVKRQYGICVDACIADTVRHLWSKGIVTHGSCCGHGKDLPSLVLEDDATLLDAAAVRDLLAEVDHRTWKLLSWRRSTDWVLREL